MKLLLTSHNKNERSQVHASTKDVFCWEEQANYKNVQAVWFHTHKIQSPENCIVCCLGTHVQVVKTSGKIQDIGNLMGE